MPYNRLASSSTPFGAVIGRRFGAELARGWSLRQEFAVHHHISHPEDADLDQ